MKRIVNIILAGIALFAAQLAPAQGTLYLSNLGETSGGSVAVGSDSWLAGIFRTGGNSGGYSLSSIQLLTTSASGSPNGFTVFLYNDVAQLPGNSLASLSGADPTPGGVFTYTASGITLSPSTAYFVVVTAATPVANGAYNWSFANTLTYDSSDGWFLGAGYFSSSDGSSWALTRPSPFQFGVNATAVPEPSAGWLIFFGIALISCLRYPRQGQASEAN